MMHGNSFRCSRYRLVSFLKSGRPTLKELYQWNTPGFAISTDLVELQ
jgi:hypothetical protein